MIGLGLLLVAGFVALMILVAKKMKSSASATPPAAVQTGGLPEHLAVALPMGAEVQSVALSAAECALSVRTPEGQKILIVDRRTGAVRQTLALQAPIP